MAAGESKSVLFVCLGERGEGRPLPRCSRSAPPLLLCARRSSAQGTGGVGRERGEARAGAGARAAGPPQYRRRPGLGRFREFALSGRAGVVGRQKAGHTCALFVIGATRKALMLRVAEH